MQNGWKFNYGFFCSQKYKQYQQQKVPGEDETFPKIFFAIIGKLNHFHRMQLFFRYLYHRLLSIENHVQ
jgi:hypothetical protein